MVSKSDLTYIGSTLLRREYVNCLQKIEEKKAVINSLRDSGDKSGIKRHEAPLKLWETYRDQIEAEARRRNMPLDRI